MGQLMALNLARAGLSLMDVCHTLSDEPEALGYGWLDMASVGRPLKGAWI